MPKVSVIMPVYNGARFVGHAVESVLAQDFRDWELIVINDGSTDGTTDILASFTDSRIRVIHQGNSGEAAARNRGLDAASGEYIGFLDADDLYLPNALGDMADFLDLHPQIDALFSDGYFCDQEGRPLKRLSEVRPGLYTGNILEPLVLDPGVIAGIICTMTRRITIQASGVRFDQTLVIGPDWDFWIHLARHARFGYLDRPTCMYRIHQSNITLTAGAPQRRLDLVRGRLKVMNTDWFAGLSLATRKRFFHDLLIGLLSHQPEQQRAVMDATPFMSLDSKTKADLLRNVASYHLKKQQNVAFALGCLRQSLSLQPGSLKAGALLRLGRSSPALAAAVLSLWQVAHRTGVGIRSCGRRKPKPVPAALRPRTD